MEKEEVFIITSYIGAWAWHIIALVLITGGIICLAIGKSEYAIVLFGLGGLSEVMSYKRKKEVHKWESSSQ